MSKNEIKNITIENCKKNRLKYEREKMLFSVEQYLQVGAVNRRNRKKYYINTKLCCIRVENEQWRVNADKVDDIKEIDYFQQKYKYQKIPPIIRSNFELKEFYEKKYLNIIKIL